MAKMEKDWAKMEKDCNLKKNCQFLLISSSVCLKNRYKADNGLFYFQENHLISFSRCSRCVSFMSISCILIFAQF